ELFCSAKEDYPQINWCYYIIFSILIFAIPFILMFWFTCKTRSCCLRGAWKTSPNTIPKKGVSLGKINLYQRELSDGKKNWKLRVIKKAKRICRTILTTIFNEMARIKRDLLLQTMGNNKSAGLPRQ
ncbi:MAG: hypothetical protein J4F41_10305, partial [Alphaproteobacteria bacterium]|nr:hypothetical protein [Alphaproteobacteria bacterium]